MTEQNPPETAATPNDAPAVDETVVPPPQPASAEVPYQPYAAPELSRGQHLAAAFRGRPVIIAASLIAALVVGLAGFVLGFAVGHHDRDRGRFGPVMFERGELPRGQGGPWHRDFGGRPNGMMPPGFGDDGPGSRPGDTPKGDSQNG